jgi:diguanylate cyclase (GGDEF)-like protein/PAS domain S-box-containing protein
MIRKLLRILGAVKTSLMITAVSILSSALLYIIINIFLGRITVIGILMSVILPAIVAPFVSYFLVRLLLQLDLTERALVRINDELELRVKQRTAELVKANEALQAEIAERKRTEAALRESEERYRLLVELSPDVILVHSEGKIVLINTAGAKLLGAANPEQLIGKFVMDFVHPDYRRIVKERVRHTLEGQEVPFLEQKILRLNGTEVDVESADIPFSYQGKPAVQLVARNITERKRAEERVQRLLSQQIAVNRLALALGESRDLNKIYHTIYEHVRALMDAEAFIVSLYNKETQLIQAEYVVAEGTVRDAASLPPIPLEEVSHGTQSQVIRTGQPLYVPDLRQAMKRTGTEHSILEDGKVVEGPPPPEEEEISRSALYVPMKIEGETIGVMQVQSYRLDAYGQKDMNLLSALANVAAIAIQNARLFMVTRRQAEQLEALRQVGLEITAQLDLDVLLCSIVYRAVELLGGTSGGLDLYRPERDVLEWAVSIGLDPATSGIVLHRGEGLSGKVWETGEPLTVDDYQHWEGRAAAWAGYPFTAVVGVPVRWGGKFLGVLEVLADPPRTFSPTDTELLSLFATQAAVAIENARLYEAERERAETLAALQETALDLAAQRALPDLLRAIAARAVHLLRAKGASVYSHRPATDDLLLAIDYNVEPDGTGAVLKRGEGLSGKVLETGQPLAVADYSHWEGRSAQFEEDGFTAVVAMPIVWGDRLLGVLNVLDDAPRTFSPADIALLERFTPLAAAALEQERLLGEERARRREAETLRQAGAAVTETLSLNDALEAILNQLQQVVPYDSASVQILEGEWLRIVAGQGFPDPEAVSGLSFNVYETSVDRYLFEERQPLLVANLDEDNRDWFAKGFDYVRSWIGVPLLVRDKLVGVLTLDHSEPGYYHEKHVQLVTAFADQVAIAIENARLYEETRQRATELSTLYEVATAGMTSIHLDEILNRTVAVLQETLRPDDIAILLAEPEMNELVIRASTGFPGGPKLVRRSIGVGIPGWVVQTGQPVLLADVREDERYHACDPDTCSELCVPLRVGEQIIGALNLESRRLGAFTEHDLRLVSTLAGNLATIIENACLYQEAERLAITDGLTGLCNRRYFYELLEREVESVDRYGDFLSLIMLDIDSFKIYNDTYGHLVGDALLSELAQLLEQNIRKVDVAARYGGDEFVILLPHTDKRQAVALAERIRTSVEEHRFPGEGECSSEVTISLGVAVCPEDAGEPEALVKAADMALLEAKKWENRVCAWGETV